MQYPQSSRSGAAASAAPKEGINDLYQKINNYVYEIRMIQIDKYVYGMNRKKIDTEKAYIMIIEGPGSGSNAIFNVWKGRFADCRLSRYKSSKVEEK